MDYAGFSMWYYFSFDQNKKSTLLIGDMGGNIKEISFYSFITRNPFKHKIGAEYTHILYSSFKKVNVYLYQNKLLYTCMLNKYNL